MEETKEEREEEKKVGEIGKRKNGLKRNGRVFRRKRSNRRSWGWERGRRRGRGRVGKGRKGREGEEEDGSQSLEFNQMPKDSKEIADTVSGGAALGCPLQGIH